MRAWICQCTLHFELAPVGRMSRLLRKPQDRSIAVVSFDRYADQPKSSQQLVMTCALLGSDDYACFGLALQLVDSSSATATYRRV